MLVVSALATSAHAAPPTAFLLPPGSTAVAPAAAPDASAGVAVGRIYQSPASGDIVSFSSAPQNVTPVSGSVFGFSVALSADQIGRAPSARLFGATLANNVSTPSFANFGPAPNPVEVGAQIGLAGGAEATFALVGSSANFGGVFAAAPSSSPAVFNFYNFPEASGNFGFGGVGALGADSAIAPALANAPAGSSTGVVVSSSPLIASLSAQGPFWYGGTSPATRGSSVSLTIPFSLARIPVKVRLGEQSMATVQSNSLANQILGPAFASSANLQYNAVGGGVSVGLPVLSRRATVSLDGLYETLQNNQAPFNLAPYAAQTGGAGTSPVIYTPVISGVQQYAGAASLAVPVTSRLTVHGSFSEQVSGTVALDALTQTLTQRTTGYSGGVAYNFPKTNSAIGFSSNRSVSTDDTLPNYNVTQNSQNLYFSVKF
jgi:hypothetical protein